MRHALRIAVLSCSLAALVVISGGHWAVLQTVAWAQMLVDYTHESGSLRQGVANTFDGAHPCELCRKISAGIQRESHDDRQKTLRVGLPREITLAQMPVDAFSAATVRPGSSLPRRVDSLEGQLAETPPVPPPRQA